jgi:bifunctional DNA-binding transcriptional regulator/antitoxin component of YhaV-PrlF toxin-antitoxin module
MFTLTMSTKGQFTLPHEVREALKLYPGCRVQGTVDEKGRLILVPALLEPEELLRRRPKAKRVVSLEEMEEGIRKGAARGRF